MTEYKYSTAKMQTGGLARKVERGFFQGHVVIGQGVMALNGKRGDSD